MNRSRLRPVLIRLIRLSGLPFFLREVLFRRQVTIILYHDIRPELARTHFRALRERYNIIPLLEYVRARRENRLKDLPPKSLVITFDDGHRGNYALKSVLEELGVPVTIFLCSGIVGTKRHYWFRHEAVGGRLEELRAVPNRERERLLREAGFEKTQEWCERRALSEDEIRELQPFVDFQGHTVFHPILPRCTDEEARVEIETSKHDLEMLLGQDVTVLSYPNGFYSERDIELARRAGYESGITVDLGLNDGNTDPFRLRRICIDDTDDVETMLVKATGVWTFFRNLLKGIEYGRVSAHGGG